MATKHSAVARVMQELEAAGTDASEVLKEVRRLSEKNAAIARDEIVEGVGRAKSALGDFGSDVADQACNAAEVTQDYVRAHPIAVLGVAAAIGLLIGSALKYRAGHRR